MTEPATKPTKRKVACEDGLNRPRHLTTYPALDRVVLLASPSEASLLTPAGARELAQGLHEQADFMESAKRAEEPRVIR